MAKNGRLRATPAIEPDNTIGRLPAGTFIEILGRSPQDAEWFRVRMPREAWVWVHGRNLVPTDDERVRRSTLEGAMLRLDSRQQARAVGSLHENELVTLQGMEHGDIFIPRQVGDWFAVHLPRLVCFVHESVVTLPAAGTRVADADTDTDTGMEAGAPAATDTGSTAGTDSDADVVATTGPTASELDRLWARVQQDYERYRRVLDTSDSRGLAQDWEGLQADLERLIAEHPRMRIKLLADKMHTQVRRMLHQARLLADRGLVADDVEPGDAEIEASEAEATSGGPVITVPPEVRETPPTVVDPPRASAGHGTGTDGAAATASDTATTASEAPATAGAAAVVDDAAPALAENGTEAAEAAEAAASGAPVGERRLSGWLFEQQVPELAVHHVLKAPSGNVLALLAVPPGSGLQLSDYFWKHVRVEGEARTVQARIDGIEQQVLVVEVAAIALLE